ncbi:unnamed protein product [Prorocentrum cordatum]|uniref:Uncharacterized protein n=1 Tax=Prorocentrum cordatum TaxID=2364126 RepID=A0ABN9PNK1_9DINO|nr:unnamed protein product [Polarella glacialis]
MENVQSPKLGKPKGTDTAAPQTSPRVHSGWNFEANPAVATRASQGPPQRGKRSKGSSMDTSFLLCKNAPPVAASAVTELPRQAGTCPAPPGVRETLPHVLPCACPPASGPSAERVLKRPEEARSKKLRAASRETSSRAGFARDVGCPRGWAAWAARENSQLRNRFWKKPAPCPEARGGVPTGPSEFSALNRSPQASNKPLTYNPGT